MKKNLTKKIFSILTVLILAFTSVAVANPTTASAETRVVWQQSRWYDCNYYGTQYYYVTFKTIFDPSEVTDAYVQILSDDNYVYNTYTAKYVPNEQCYKAPVGKFQYATKYRMVIETVSRTGKQQTYYSEMRF